MLQVLYTWWDRSSQPYDHIDQVRLQMLNFEEELKKFKPSLEIEDAEEIIYNQDLDDMSDVLVKLLKDAKDEADSAKRTR